MTLPTQLMKTLKRPTQLPTLMQNHSGGDNGVRCIIPDPSTSPSLISLNGFCGRKAQSFLSFPAVWLSLYSLLIHTASGASAPNLK